MRFKIVAVDEPERALDPGVPGALALFDLANIYTVSAVLTADLAVQRGSGFEVLGRITGAELRGCNFLMPGAA